MKASPDPAVALVLAAVREALAAAGVRRESTDAGTPTSIAVAFSGGRDSTALLDTLATLAAEFGFVLSAVHVHHGLSSNADAWADFCAETCAKQGVPLTVRRVAVARAGSESLEAAARAARYAAFASIEARYVALAHHADDQAETVLLQLLRGAGPRGLAAMPLLRESGSGSTLLRPFLALPQQAIAAYVAARELAFVTDESNVDTRRKRNFLRHQIAPRLAAAFPGYPATLARAAQWQAEAAELADALAALDADGAVARDADGVVSLDRALLAKLAAKGPARARNLLRGFLRELGLAAPSSARLAAMLDQLATAAPDARVRLVHAGIELGVHRGRIIAHPPPLAPYAIAWCGEAAVELPHGTLEFVPCVGGGIAATAPANDRFTIRPRTGGERIRLAQGGPSRSLKHLLHEAGIAPWQRDAYPLVFGGDVLAAVPGIGVDTEFQAAPGAAGYEVRWHPVLEWRRSLGVSLREVPSAPG